MEKIPGWRQQGDGSPTTLALATQKIMFQSTDARTETSEQKPNTLRQTSQPIGGRTQRMDNAIRSHCEKAPAVIPNAKSSPGQPLTRTKILKRRNVTTTTLGHWKATHTIEKRTLA